MKRASLLFICLFPLFLLAQEVNLTGRWEGYLDQSASASKMKGYQVYWEKGIWKKGVKTHKLRLTFKAPERKSKYYKGEYYITNSLNKAQYGRFAIKATYKNGIVEYETTSKIFEVKNRINTSFCYSTAKLKWSEDQYYEYLEGEWEGWNEDRRACASAHVWLRRRKRVPTPPPPPPVEVEDTTPVAEPPVVVETPPTPPTPPTPVVVDTPPVESPVIPAGDPSLRQAITKERLYVNKDSISISVWDDNRVDGDIISLVYNGKVLLSNHTLTKAPKAFRVKLQPGRNIITLIAHNLGEIPPNTAAVEVERNEGKKRVVLESDMDKSESIVILKE